MNQVSRLTIKGFKTFKDLDFQPGLLNILIGPNGAGKSNFIAFFRMLNWMMASPPNLQQWVGMQMGASAVLHDGVDKTRDIEAELSLQTEQGINDYKFRLAYAGGDTLIFVDEACRFSNQKYASKARWKQFDPGQKESRLATSPADKTERTISSLLRGLVVYQFHNTSFTSRMRTKWNVADGQWLKEDGANLGAVLYQLSEDHLDDYQRIVEILRLLVPFFADFILEPVHDSILLQWRERNSDMIFNASQASDGMLRAMALVTLLGMPDANIPDVLILDEPELGLHPYAIDIIGGMVRSLASRKQIFLATQSALLVDQFDVNDIVVVERSDRESSFRRLSEADLEQWLDEYTISELWQKNILGGRPQ